MSTVKRSDLPFPLLREGKVREIFDLGDHLLLVASDRISAFDCVIPQPIPDKGSVLTQLSRYWFDRTGHIVQNHCVSADPDRIIEIEPRLADTRDRWAGRGMLVLRADPFAVECVVRGGRTDLLARHQGRGRSRREHHVRSGQENRRQQGRRVPEGQEPRAVSVREGPRSPERNHHRGHQVRVRHFAHGRVAPDRRGADARFVALLAGK